ncbi:hypothetical protein Stube_58690 [Streptomyces tubercidicus]|uniref:Uncharacterized protein n=2 Tax=Streptomyces tubercidicus TaxID=47759 RepID=A0A640V4Y2_9ACTN|nr:hypothetical protein Stube_58690 [Streptomyces tubercidicus]
MSAAGTATLLVALSGAVVSCDPEPSQRADKQSPAAATHSQGRPKLQVKYAMNTYYLPRAAGSEATEYKLHLATSKPSPGSAPRTIKNVKVTFDLSAVKNKATLYWINNHYGCKRSADSLTCTPGDIKEGAGAEFTPFAIRPEPHAGKGPAGPLKITVTGANASTAHHTTQLVIGAPVLTARQPEKLTEVKPGSELPLTPAFGNNGDTDIDDDLTVVLKADQATLRKQYRNCRYDKAAAPTKAVCTFSGPLPAGAAYETDGPLTAVTDKTARRGSISYSVYRAHDTQDAELLPDSAPRGTGAPLALRPVDGSGSAFTDSGHWKAEMAKGELEFVTTEIRDRHATGFTIKGKVGQVVDVDVLGSDAPYQGATRLTLPEGMSLEGPRDGDPSEFLFCTYAEGDDGPVECPEPKMTSPTLRVRVDKRVEGAQGSISVASDPSDPDQDNNTAPIKVEYLD